MFFLTKYEWATAVLFLTEISCRHLTPANASKPNFNWTFQNLILLVIFITILSNQKRGGKKGESITNTICYYFWGISYSNDLLKFIYFCSTTFNNTKLIFKFDLMTLISSCLRFCDPGSRIVYIILRFLTDFYSCCNRKKDIKCVYFSYFCRGLRIIK